MHAILAPRKKSNPQIAGGHAQRRGQLPKGMCHGMLTLYKHAFHWPGVHPRYLSAVGLVCVSHHMICWYCLSSTQADPKHAEALSV